MASLPYPRNLLCSPHRRVWHPCHTHATFYAALVGGYGILAIPTHPST
ncbi:hypothetical protein [Leyella stercorea]